MKKLLLLAFLSGTTLFYSCSKSSSTKPTIPSTTATITDTVVIGNQTWTSVNYNGSGGVNYNNSSTNDPTYGKLYTLAEAKAIVLPKGWHLPSTDDFNTLMKNLGVTLQDGNGYYQPSQTVTLQLMSTSKWTLQSGGNNTGFSAYPAGFYNTSESKGFSSQGTEADFITTSTLVGYPGTQANFSIYEEKDANQLLISSVFSDEVG
ncbi:FISUMP domain-containing protein [Mucilaginibacter sp.]